MLTPAITNRVDLASVRWAADTGCYLRPEAYNDDLYLAWLGARPRETNAFATAPDVVGDAAATWKQSAPMLESIRALGFQAALVAQDGIEDEVVDWGAFDVLFIGGSDGWKLGQAAWEIGREAKARGKRLHWGRVNTLRRLMLARKAHADSCDGTYLAFGPDKNLPRLQRWLRWVNGQQVLPW